MMTFPVLPILPALEHLATNPLYWPPMQRMEKWAGHRNVLVVVKTMRVMQRKRKVHILVSQTQHACSQYHRVTGILAN
jgi:hypothetical protein